MYARERDKGICVVNNYSSLLLLNTAAVDCVGCGKKDVGVSSTESTVYIAAKNT